MEETNYLPGNLVRARGRVWVVQNGSTNDWLKLRPLSGAEDEVVELDPYLELVPVEAATFGLPAADKSGRFDCAKLLYDALRFQLKNGAGPFRSFASYAFEPRPYQLVPLLMAMKMETIRLLIADDVGIGKTIEAGMIAREMLDRGEISSFAVLCPPHLVEQWVEELGDHFNIKAAALTSGSAERLEKAVPHGQTLVDVYPFLVVSLDYIKSDRRRDFFRTIAPKFIIVDEAHTCSHTGSGRQMRFELLQKLASESDRHILLLTATPHSGKEDSFYNLLSLLDEKFLRLKGRAVRADDKLRLELAQHFVQRRRKDIVEEAKLRKERFDGFPVRMSTELTYKLDKAWNAFFEHILSYCRNLVEESEDGKQKPMIWYAVLALLRCASSSPAAAEFALKNRLEGVVNTEKEIAVRIHEDVGDGDESDLETSDVAPAANVEEKTSTELKALIEEAEKLKVAKKDPKYSLLKAHVKKLIAEGFHPVVFCRYINTANYVAEALANDFPKVTVDVVTGELVPDERKERVEKLEEADSRILVATDCLSEGINLQRAFTSVIHYDLAWNPTRHEQRDGRVDRFGQDASEVRSTLIYGQDNPVDGFILNVILRKSREIQQKLGVIVPVPEDEVRINEALIKASLFKKTDNLELKTQGSLDFGIDTAETLNEKWENALDRMTKVQTVFAQRKIHPDEVYGLWQKQKDILGSHEDLCWFCREASALMDCHLEPIKGQADKYRVPVGSFDDESLRVRLQAEGFTNKTVLNLKEIHRADTFVAALSESFLDLATEGANSRLISRTAVTESSDIDVVTSVFLLRIRYQMFIRYRNQLQKTVLAEEIYPIVARGLNNPEWGTGQSVVELISEKRRLNLAAHTAAKWIQRGIDTFDENAEMVKKLVQQRSEALLNEHSNLRQFASAGGAVNEIKVCEPVDLMGVFVLLPSEE